MSPTLVVKEGQVVLALGGSGGTAIATSVTQSVLASLAFGLSPREIVNAPRFYVPTRGSSLLVEEGAHKALLDDLAWRGEVVDTLPRPSVSITLLDRHGGVLRAAADPRKYGLSIVR
jgi:gamma-glutamyltranspeptidase/glutathione hydrolase